MQFNQQLLWKVLSAWDVTSCCVVQKSLQFIGNGIELLNLLKNHFVEKNSGAMQKGIPNIFLWGKTTSVSEKLNLGHQGFRFWTRKRKRSSRKDFKWSKKLVILVMIGLFNRCFNLIIAFSLTFYLFFKAKNCWKINVERLTILGPQKYIFVCRRSKMYLSSNLMAAMP